MVLDNSMISIWLSDPVSPVGRSMLLLEKPVFSSCLVSHQNNLCDADSSVS